MSALNQKTLILNKMWMPIGISTVREAIVLLYRDVAKAVCPESFQTYDFDDWLAVPSNGNGYVQTIKRKIAAPYVMVLNTYDRVPTISTFSKRNVLKRDRYTCQYCGKQSRDLTIDHVLPKSKGGETVWENVVSACEECNKSKADKDLKKSGMTLRNVPYRPDLNMAKIIRKRIRNHSVWQKFI